MNRKLIRVALYAAILGTVLYAAVYFSALNGDAYRTAAEVLKSSEDLQERVGQITHIQLSPFGSYREKVAGSTGNATFEIKVVGNRGTINVLVQMKKRNNKWKLENAQADGKAIAIGQK